MHNWSFDLTRAFLKTKAQQFLGDERADEIFEKAAVIAAVTVAVMVIIALGSLAADALRKGESWFGG
jgi:hypothetical protein